MSLVLSRYTRQKWELYLDSSRACTAGPTGTQSAMRQHADLPEAFGHINDSSKGSVLSPSVCVWLSGALARPFLVGPIAGLKRWSEAVALAQASAFVNTDLDGPCAVTLDAWPRERPALATALRHIDLERIRESAASRGVRVISIRPWWARVVDRLNAEDSRVQLVAVEDSESLTVITGTGTQMNSASTYMPSPGALQMEALLARVALLADVPREAARPCLWAAEHWSGFSPAFAEGAAA